MKKLVRKGCFETNSSSTHSIVVARDDQDFVIDTIYPDQDGKVIVEKSDFGWEWRKYNDAITKLSYAYTDGVDTDLLREVVMEQTGAEDVIFLENEGYIDHQSACTAREVCTGKIETKNFIFNKNSWLFTGNDNSTADPTFYDVPEIKDGKMIKPRYKYELIIDNFEKTTKFKTEPSEEEIDDAITSLLEGGVCLDEGGYFIEDDSVFWQISRPRNTYYTKTWKLEQDYSKMEILFLKENDPRMREIERELELTKVPWHEKMKIKTKKALEIEGLVKKVKFEIKKI